MIELNLLAYKEALKTKQEDGQPFIFDPIRKKWLVLQPEEIVRQLVVHYLIEEKGYNKNRINVEKQVIFNKLQKRCDILVYGQDMSHFLLVECKAPRVNIDQATFKQIAIYNMTLRVDYLLVTNGRQTYCCKMDYEKESYEFIEEIPMFNISS